MSMKKFFIAFLLLLSLPVFAAEKNLSFGDTMTLYFTEIFPTVDQDIDDIIVKFSDIGLRHSLRSALQRGIYYGMMPNTDVPLNPDTMMTDRAFAQILRLHFGTEITGDTSSLTMSDYERYMQPIRTSYAYRLL